MTRPTLTAARLKTLLGWAGDPPPAQATLASSRAHGAHRLHEIALTINGAAISGLFMLPDGPGPYPAVLYAHAHGNRYAIGADELIHGRPALQGPYGPALADLGIASLAIDLAPFGARQAQGAEAALAKAALWQGRPMMGQMLAELSATFDWLIAQTAIDSARIATLGLSMGATHAYWLAALEPRIAACAHLCVLADIAPLIATGAHDLHGPYMTVPGLLAHGDMGDVAALVAPRPQFVGLGADDPLTPAPARDPALTRLAAAYRNAPEALEVHLAQDSGHVETPAMRAAVLDFLQRHLCR